MLPNKCLYDLICVLNAKRLGEGGTQTFDDHKYSIVNPG